MFDNSRLGPEGRGSVASFQEAAALLPQVIGHIQTVIGSGTLARACGIAGEVNVGDPVCQGDVIETAADGRVGIRFIDGTAFNLSGGARMALEEFVCDANGTSHSALFGVTRGTFSFVVGQMAKTGCLSIDTPVGSIRGRARAGGIGMLSLTALIFSVLKEVQAAEFSSHRPLLDSLDDDNIKPKDLDLNGVIELFLRDGRHLTLDDPGQEFVISRTGSISMVAISPARMVELHNFQQDAIASYAQGLPASTGVGGSSTPPSLLLPPQGLQPINFIEPSNPAPHVNPGTASSSTDSSGPNVIFYLIKITIPPDVWIDPTGGLWSTASNWDRGVPTAGVDVVIPDEMSIAGTFAVTIATAAVASTVTLNAGTQLINNSTLTIGNTLTVLNNGVLNNSGAVSVGGRMELLDQSSLQNAGLITLGQGGDFSDQSTVSNTITGTIEVASGTLNVLVDVANSGQLMIDPGATLTLNGSTVTGGTVTDNGVIDLLGAAALKNGSLGNNGQFNVSGVGNALDGETVSNLGAIEVTGVLTLDFGTTITGGVLANSGTVKIEAVSGATLDGVNVENSAGVIQVDNILSSTLVVDDGTTITGGTITIGPVGTFEVTTALGATLDGVSVGNSGVVQVDAGSELNLDGTTIAGGTISDNGTIEVTGDSAINSAMVNGGQVTLDAGQALTLDGSKVMGTTITDSGTVKVDVGQILNLSGVALNGGAISNLGFIDIVGDSSISSDALSNNQLTIDSTKTLTLNGTIITDGTVTDNGIIHVTGNSAINDAAIVGGQIVVDAGLTLTLDGSTVTDTVITNVGAVQNAGAVQIDVGKMRFLSGVALSGGTINNLGTLVVIGDSSISNDVLNNNLLIIDATKTLTLDLTTVIGGTVTDNGTILIAGDTAINDAAVNGGQVTVDVTETLTLDGTTVTGTAITDNGTVKVDGGKTLNLSGIALSGGAISNLGLLDIIGDSSISNDVLTNTAVLEATNSSILELTNTTVTNTGGAITVATGATLDLDGGDSISGGALGNSGTLDATGINGLHGMAITNSGTLESTGGVLTIDGCNTTFTNSGLLEANGGELDLNNDTLTNTGTLEATNSSILELTSTTVTNTGGAITVADALSTLDLDGGDSISGGALGNSGTLDATGINGLHGMAITNSGTLESTGGVLTIDGSNTTFSNSGLLEANGGELDLNNDTLTNTGTLEATNSSTLELTNTTLTNTGGVITVADALSTLDLDGGDSISGGALGNSGTLDATGINGLHGMAITNSDLLEANGGELDLNNDTLTNTGTLEATNGSTLELTNTTLTNTGGVITVADALSTLDLDGGDSITNGALGNSGTLDATGTNALHGMAITNALGATLESTGGVLTIDGSNSTFSNSGLLEANGGELDLNNDTLTNTGTLRATNGSILELNNTAVINTSGTVTIDALSTLDLDGGDSITNGALGNSGTLDATGINGLHGMAITNSGTLESTGGVLTIDGSNTTFTNSGLLEADGGELDLNNDTLTNTGTLKATNSSILELTNTAVINTGGTVTIDALSTLDLDGGDSITNGALGNSGTLDATGTNALHGMAITNALGATLESTGGVLTIDGSNSTFSNSGLLEANGGELDLNNDTLTNAGTLEATNGSTLELTNTTLTNTGGTVTIDALSTLDLDGGDSITNGSLGNSGTLDATGTNALHGMAITNALGATLEVTGGELTVTSGSVGNAGKIEVVGGTLDLDSLTVSNTVGTASVQVDGGAFLDLEGAGISGGLLSNSGTVTSTGSSALSGVTTTNNSVLDVASGELSVTGGSVGNAGKIEVVGGTLDLDSLTVSNTVGTASVQVDGGAFLDLEIAGISGGLLSNSGTVTSTGSSALSGVTTTNNSVLDVASGELTVTGGSVGNAGKIEVVGGTLDLDNLTVSNTVGTASVQVDGGAFLDLEIAGISGGLLSNSGTVTSTGSSALSGVTTTNNSVLDVASGELTVTGGSVGNAGKIEVVGGTLDLDSLTVSNTVGTASVQVDGGAFLDLEIAGISGGLLSNSGTVTSTGSSALSGVTTTNNSVLDVASGELTVTGGSVGNAGKIEVVGGTLDLDSLTVSNTVGTASVQVDGGAFLDLEGAGISGGLLSNSGTVNVSGLGNALHGVTVTANNALEIMASAALLVDLGSAIANSGGTVKVDGTGTLTLNGTTITGGTVTDNGTITAIAMVDISGNIIGTGAIDISNLISNPAQLEIGGSVASTNTVFFQGSQDELILDHSSQFSGLITGSGSSVGTILTLDDEIDLRDLSFTSSMSFKVLYDSILNISTVTFSDGTNNIAIQLSGDYTNQGWKFLSDGDPIHHGTLVQLAPPPVFSDIINGQYAFTGVKTAQGLMWTFQAAVTDPDANFIGQGGITKFELYDNGALIGSAEFVGGTWTFPNLVTSVNLLSSVNYAGGIYTITTSSTTIIKNNDTLTITAFDAANSSASKSVTLSENATFNVAPAGIAGDPINLALTDPSGGQPTGPVDLTFAGVPSDWSINEGTNLGNGTWTVGTNDLSALTVTTAAAYTGAMVLSVTETWTNADGSTGIAVVSDNVEAYAPGSPIFALSGNDTLTGAGGNDLFVFAQPIGHDTVYSFDAAHDQIDLIGYAGFTSFADIQAHLAEDANGDAVITLGNGQSIELQGVHAAALTQSNFVFDQMPTLDNAGTMTIGDGAVMPLSGTINNTGTIALSSTGDETDLQLIEHGVTLEGGGKILLSDSDANIISGTSSSVTLDNEDNAISGAGHLGNGELTLTNAGTIDATGTHALTIDTGSNLVLNSGVLEASGSGGMTVASGIVNSGVLWANGANLTVLGAVSGNGTATIDGVGTLDFEASTIANVVFGSGAAGTLKLGDSFHFNGMISGFGGSDTIDLANVASATASISYHENAAGTGGTLAVSNGAQIVELSLQGHYTADNFSIIPDHATGTLVTFVPHHDLIV